MNRLTRLFLLICLVFSSFSFSLPPGLYATFQTSLGNITCELYPDKAPATVANFIGLATGTKEWADPYTREIKKAPLYNKTIFHRIIPNFMIQGGDPTGTGRGGPGYQFADEFTPTLSHDRPGRLSMANAGPNTNGSQFFITQVPTPWLNYHHTIFGQVVEGMDVVLKMVAVERNQADKPLKDIVLSQVVIMDTRITGNSTTKPTAN